MKTKTVDEAMELLHRYRKEQIKIARSIAEELIEKNGEATTGDVFETMSQRGLVDERVPKYWLGAVFRNKKYTWSGRTKIGIGHDELAKVWIK